MPSHPKNNNNNNGGGRGNNRNIRFNNRVINGRIQLPRHPPPGFHNQQGNPFRQNHSGAIRRTIFNSGGPLGNIRPFHPGTSANRPRMHNMNRMNFFQPRQFGRSDVNNNQQPATATTSNNNSNISFEGNSQQSSGVLGRMEADGTFVPINPQDLFGNRPGPFGHNMLGAHTQGGFAFPGSLNQQNMPRKILCKHYANARGCLNGSRCLYMHEDFPCKLFHILGQCLEGDQCKYSHATMSLQTKSVLAAHVEKGVDGFPRMSRNQVFASIREQELRHQADPVDQSNSTDTVFTIDSSSPQLLELQKTADDDVKLAHMSNAAGEKNPGEILTDKVPADSNPFFDPPKTKGIPPDNTNPFFDTPRVIPQEIVKPAEPPGPTIHQIIQNMRKRIEESRPAKKDKENGRGTIIRLNRARPSTEETIVAQGESFTVSGNTGIQVSLNLQTLTSESSASSSQTTFRTVAATSSLFGHGKKRPSRPVPSLDSIISTCIGHGPPFTSWQLCQIYNSCAQYGSNVSLSDLKGFNFQHC